MCIIIDYNFKYVAFLLRSKFKPLRQNNGGQNEKSEQSCRNSVEIEGDFRMKRQRIYFLISLIAVQTKSKYG